MSISAIPTCLSRVRSRWQLLRLARAAMMVLAALILIIGALVVVDLAYHLPERPRLVLMGLAALALAAAAARILMRARRRLSDTQAALLIEARHPGLRGLAVAAAEFHNSEPASEEAAMLQGALVSQAAERLGALDLPSAVDRRPFLRSATTACAMLAIGALLLGFTPGGPGHTLERALLPWVMVPPTAAELAAQKKAVELEAKARELAAAAARAAAEASAPVKYAVKPGACEVLRGGALDITATVSRVDSSPQLRLRLSDGSWRALPMSPSGDDASTFTVRVEDIADDASYCVAMENSASPTFPISVYDQVEATDVHIDYHFPAYALMPDRMVKGADIEAIIGTTARLSITANGDIGAVKMVQDDGTAVPVTVHGNQAEAQVAVAKDGGYLIEAMDAKGHHEVSGLSGHYAIHAVPDNPPGIMLIYPAIDTAVHPLEQIAIAANAEDDVGIKEVRLVSTYGLEPSTTERHSCLPAAGKLPLKQVLAQFTVDLKKRNAQNGDVIIFHVEVEDLKGQTATTDPFLLTVRGYETMVVYANGNVGAGHNGQNSAAYVTLFGALHDLSARKSTLTPEQFKAECEHIAEMYVFRPIAQ